MNGPLTRILAAQNATIEKTYALLRQGRIVWPAGHAQPFVVAEDWMEDFDVKPRDAVTETG